MADSQVKDYLKKKWEQISKTPVENKPINVGNGKFEMSDIFSIPTSILQGFIDTVSSALGSMIASLKGCWDTVVSLIKGMFNGSK